MLKKVINVIKGNFLTLFFGAKFGDGVSQNSFFLFLKISKIHLIKFHKFSCMVQVGTKKYKDVFSFLFNISIANFGNQLMVDCHLSYITIYFVKLWLFKHDFCIKNMISN